MSLIDTETLAIILLVIVSIVALVVSRLRIPYSVALVVVGLILSFQRELKVEVTPQLILALFIPPIAFEAAFNLEMDRFLENLRLILALAVGGTLIGAVAVGGLVALFGGTLPLAQALVFGALISATDPVAVISLFKANHVAQRLSILMDSESLLNDGTAIVLFNIALVAALTGGFDPLGGVLDFVRVSIGGVVIGGLLGWGVASLLSHIDDPLVETTVTTCLAFGAYLLAERFQTSGVLAVVVAGLIVGHTAERSMSPTTRIAVSGFWSTLSFVANSLVFLLIGLTINITQLTGQLGLIALAVVAVLLSRAIIVYGIGALTRRTDDSAPMAWQHVIFWGGLRGAVSLALALSLPAALSQRAELQAMTFGVVLFTLLVQATTMPPLLRRLGLGQRSAKHLEHDMRLGRVYAAEAAWHRMRTLHSEGVLTGDLWANMEADHDSERQRLQREIHDLYASDGELSHELTLAVQRESLRAERAALNKARQRGLIGEEAFERLSADVDQRLDTLRRDHETDSPE